MKDYGGNPEDLQHRAEVPELVLKVSGSWKHRGTGMREEHKAVQACLSENSSLPAGNEPEAYDV